MRQRQSEDFLARVPDDPLHVEARGLALAGGVTALAADGDSGFVFSPAHGLAVLVGLAQGELARQLRGAVGAHAPMEEAIEIHLDAAVAPGWLALLGAQQQAEARMHHLPETADGRLGSMVRHGTEQLLGPRSGLLETLPRDLVRELRAQPRWPQAVCSLAGGAAASVAYAFTETETRFDLSIDTVSAFRREGFGRSAAAALILDQLERGRRPVWGAETTNGASLAMAASMGFEPVGTVAILRLEL